MSGAERVPAEGRRRFQPKTSSRESRAALAPAIATTAAVVGLYLSYSLNLAAGGLIVLVATGFFLLSWCFAPRHGLLAKVRARGFSASRPG